MRQVTVLLSEDEFDEIRKDVQKLNSNIEELASEALMVGMRVLGAMVKSNALKVLVEMSGTRLGVSAVQWRPGEEEKPS